MGDNDTTPSSKFQQAMTLQKNGHHAQARAICREILASQPRNFDALYLSGMIAAQQREFYPALEGLREALAVQPKNPAVHYNLGWVQGELGQLDAALVSFEQAVALHPQFAQALFSRAVVLKKLGRLDAALDSYDRLIAIRPDHADAYYNRGRVLHELNRRDEALASYDRAIAHRPSHAGAYCNRGIVLGDLGRWEAALSSYDRAIEIDPRDAVALYNRGVALRRLGRWDEALASTDQAIDVHPDFAEAHSNRGVLLADLNRFEDALASYDRAIALNAELADAYYGKGNVLAVLGQMEAAVSHQEKAIALMREFPLAHFARATALLLAGDFERGWLAYERRRELPGAANAIDREFPGLAWRGDESIAGRTVLLYGEQGLGDTLQFCRYATEVVGLGARVILQVPSSLKTLLMSLQGVEVVAQGEALPCFDRHCTLASLPLAFKTTLNTIPAPRRYLHSPNDRLQFWRAKLTTSTAKLKVGLVWSGGFRPKRPDLWSIDRHRNVPFEKLAPLRNPDIEFFSLQIGQPAAADPARLLADGWDGPAIIDYTSFIGDFADTAGLIDNLDLVIAVDTSTAHLAGALGKPVWILNRFDTCWRWLQQREDSPWYPTAKLYRQPAPGDWDAVIRRVRSDLFRLV